MSSVGTFFSRAFGLESPDINLPAMPAPPSRRDADITEAQRRSRRAAAAARGLGDTILTGALGDTTGPAATKKQLLG